MGSDTMNSDRKNFRNVSIHAPVWGATYTRQHRPRIYLFQSTLPYGERQHFLHMVHKVVPFQSTLPYGERQHFVDIIATSHRFQSTLPYGERQSIALKINAIMIVSIHAPVWGATLLSVLRIAFSLFQSTLPYGERRRSLHDSPGIRKFQSTLPYGERLRQAAETGTIEQFQSTLPYGERQQSRTIFLPFSVIVYAIITILLY